MIQIDRHIEILLLDNDCVIVPGLGGFMAHHVCAQYYPDTQTFLPPMRQLGFNAQLKINDSLLAQSYIEAYDISYPEAIRIIENEVQELMQQLQNEGYCELNDIGTLRLNVEGNIEFEPCEAGILTPELYGLNSVDITLLAEHQQTADKASTHEAEGTKQRSDIFGEAPKPAPELTVTDTHTESNDGNTTATVQKPRTLSIKISTIKRAATIAAAILLLFMCSIPFGNMNNTELSQSYIDTGVLYRLLPKSLCDPEPNQRTVSFKKATPVNEVVAPKAETSKAKTEAKDEVKAAKAESEAKAEIKASKAETDAKAEVKAPKAEEKPAVSKPFHSIVLASRVTRTNAEEYVSRLKKSGYDKAEMIIRPNGSVKVIYGHYASEDDARQMLRNMQKSSDDFSEAWIMQF